MFNVLTIQDIQQNVADYYKLPISDMYSARRKRCMARPRQIAMYLCRKLTPLSQVKIGQKFGGKDHTTVIHAIRNIEYLICVDESIKCDIEHIIKGLEV